MTRTRLPRTATITLDEGHGKSVIYIETKLARAADPQLNKLIRTEEKLGELRNTPSVREGGSHPEIDKLYQDMHQRNAEVQTLLAREVIRGLAGQVDNNQRELDELAEAAEFDPYACGMGRCRCSPGTVVRRLRRDGRPVQVVVR